MNFYWRFASNKEFRNRDKPYNLEGDSYFNSGVESWVWHEDDSKPLKLHDIEHNVNPLEFDNEMKIAKTSFWDSTEYQNLIKMMVIIAAVLAGLALAAVIITYQVDHPLLKQCTDAYLAYLKTQGVTQ